MTVITRRRSVSSPVERRRRPVRGAGCGTGVAYARTARECRGCPSKSAGSFEEIDTARRACPDIFHGLVPAPRDHFPRGSDLQNVFVSCRSVQLNERRRPQRRHATAGRLASGSQRLRFTCSSRFPKPGPNEVHRPRCSASQAASGAAAVDRTAINRRGCTGSTGPSGRCSPPPVLPHACYDCFDIDLLALHAPLERVGVPAVQPCSAGLPPRPPGRGARGHRLPDTSSPDAPC